jgi:hypothetical protein
MGFEVMLVVYCLHSMPHYVSTSAVKPAGNQRQRHSNLLRFPNIVSSVQPNVTAL